MGSGWTRTDTREAQRAGGRRFALAATALAAGLAWTGWAPASGAHPAGAAFFGVPALGEAGWAPASGAHPAGAAPRGTAGGQPGGSVLDGVFTEAQASRGERTFRQACSACHDTGEFSGGRFRLTWVGRSAGELFDTISTLMPEGDPGSLSPAEYASVVAYLLQLNGYPAGSAALPASPSALRALEIVEAP